MRKLKEYTISPNTSLIYPHYDEHGKLCSTVMCGGEFIHVEMSPTDIVKHSLLKYGSNLPGSIEGTKMILGDILMAPVVISEVLGMYWFPSKSPSSKECLWFSLEHILTIQEVSKERSNVIFQSGTTFAVDSGYERLASKHQRTCLLKYLIEAQTQRMKMERKMTRSVFMIYKNRKDRNYQIQEE